MEWKNINGTYAPGYLLIKLLQTTADVKDIKDIDPLDQRTFFHEYTHFLQNITTGFGHSYIWYMYDRIRQVISDLQKNKATELQIPLSNPTIVYQQNIGQVMRSLEGSYSTKGLDDSTATVSKISLYNCENFRKLFPKSSVHFLKLQLRDGMARTIDYRFGESAVSETMANLMEEKLYGQHKIANFPYKAATLLARHVYPEFEDNEEWLFALCDLSMCCPYPGMTFYTTLLDFSQRKFIPSQTEDIYTYGEQLIIERGWKVWDVFENNKRGALHVLSELFNHDFFKETLEWFSYLLETGYQYRRENPSFMLQLYRDGNAFTGLWKNMYEVFGTPMSQTQDHKRYFWAPAKLKEQEHLIEPMFLLSMKQVNDLLFDGKYRCGLYEFCSKANKGPETDYRCVSEPWLRSTDNPTCAFGAQWQLYGLADKRVTFSAG